jgi:hypothetical protein
MRPGQSVKKYKLSLWIGGKSCYVGMPEILDIASNLWVKGSECKGFGQGESNLSPRCKDFGQYIAPAQRFCGRLRSNPILTQFQAKFLIRSQFYNLLHPDLALHLELTFEIYRA